MSMRIRTAWTGSGTPSEHFLLSCFRSGTIRLMRLWLFVGVCGLLAVEHWSEIDIPGLTWLFACSFALAVLPELWNTLRLLRMHDSIQAHSDERFEAQGVDRARPCDHNQ